MHKTAEEGIAAHWRYKEGEKGSDKNLVDRFAWLKHAFEWLQDTVDSKEFLELLKIDLFQDEVFVFTPKGDLKRLPRGSTVLDFAFAVHTDIGFHCVGAKVNRKIAHLSDELNNGDVVEIFTSLTRQPSRDWMEFVKTAKAKSKLRTFFRSLEDKEITELGRRLLEKEWKKLGLKGKLSLDLTQELGIKDLYSKLARGELSPRSILKKLFPSEIREEAALSIAPLKPMGLGLKIAGTSDILLSLAHCCQPVPGDEVVGFVTRGRGVSVHRVDCPNLPPLLKEEERTIRVEWDTK